MKNTEYKIYNCNEERLEQQKEYLRNEIINGDNSSYIKVIDLECGTGKTIEAEKALAQMAMTSNEKALFVRERKADCIESAERINEMASLFGKATVAIVINRDTHTQEEFDKIKDKLKEYPIIIITHAKYKALSVSKNKRYFKNERNILIIDEFLDFSKGNQLSISKKLIDKFETLLGNRLLRSQYQKCVKELEDYLKINAKKHSYFNTMKNDKDKKIIGKEIDNLVMMAKNHITVEYPKTEEYETKKDIFYDILALKQFYNQTCAVDGEIIYCTDRRPQYWLLDNNIMLDAGARLTPAYKYNTCLFHVQRQTPVLDHSKWSFSCPKINSSKGSKANAINYYDDIVKQAIEKNNSEDTLIIDNKTGEELICAKYKNHFGNLNGSNEYRGLSNVIIAHNPNMPFRDYVLEYLYHSNEKIDNRSKWTCKNVGRGTDKVSRFNDERLEKYRQRKNAEKIYQAIKRVNRNMEKESMVTIINNDGEVIDRVIKMFKNCILTNDEEYGIVKYKETKKDRDTLKRKENKQSVQFIKLCQEILKSKHNSLLQQKKDRKGDYNVVDGVYSKQKIREYLGIEDKDSFRKNILYDLDVIDFCTRKNITGLDGGQTLFFSV